MSRTNGLRDAAKVARQRKLHYPADQLMLAADTIDSLRTRVEELEAAIEKHQLRKVHATCAPLPGRVGKYGCSDIDRRLWSVLDPQ